VLSCKEVAVLLSRAVDGELSLLERMKLRAHLALCGSCRQVLRQFKTLRTAIATRAVLADPLGNDSNSHPLPDKAREKILNALNARIADEDAED
jgi:predicted anti-sigma-YlaC factor YlaD